METKRKTEIGLRFASLLILLLGLLLLNLFSGSTRLPAAAVLHAVFRPGSGSLAEGIVWNIRLPRLLSAALLGGALALSGFLLQTFFGNPIAGPFVLGISSGAKLFVALCMIFCLGRGLLMSSAVLIAAAFCGAMAAMSFLLLAAGRLRGMSLLIVCGVMIGYICSAITDFVITFADDANIVNLHNWSLGSFSGIGWRDLAAAGLTVAASLLAAVFLAKPMSAYQLGEAYAGTMGVDLRRFRVALILLSSILAACVTAFAGPISFVGVAVPHLMKRLFKTAKPLLMIPACFFGGGVFCLFADWVARTLFAPTELSISSVTAIFGAPVVIAMLLKRKRGETL